jgi:hypothetical protein
MSHLRIAMLVLLAEAAVGCADSHPPPRSCSTDTECGPLATCIGEADGSGLCADFCPDSLVRCSNGAYCRVTTAAVCSPGGAVAEGDVSLRAGADCAFGLADTVDFTAEPLVYRCEPACNDDDDCRGGEVCFGGRCGVPCSETQPCPSPNRCMAGYCANERRFRAADCNGNGEYDFRPYDCAPGLVCDSSAIGGCTHPPPGEE